MKAGAAEFAVDRRVEQRAVAQAMVLVEEEADGPDLPRLLCPLCPDLPTHISGAARFHWVELWCSHDCSPAATMAKGATGPSTPGQPPDLSPFGRSA
jgi:hypothetical protein